MVIVYAIAAWVGAALLCYLLLRKATYNILDPLLITHFFIPFIAAELVVLCLAGSVPWDKFPLFWVSLLAYLVGARLASGFFGRETLRQSMIDTLARIRRSEVFAVLLMTVCTTLVLAALAIQYGGAEGDARQGFARVFRPLVVLQNGLFLLSLVLLLSRRLTGPQVAIWMVLLVGPSIAFSGKSVLIPVLYWFGLRLYLNRQAVTFRVGAGMFGLGFLGVGVMGVLAYRTTSIVALVYLFALRLWASGETYIYAYQWNAMAGVRDAYHVSFIPYMLHPITSLVGIRAYDKPLGAMLFSQVMPEDIVGGPNPIMPVLLDFFFPDNLAMSALVALLIGLLVVGIRTLGIVFGRSRSRYVKLGGIAAAIFCPAMGFLDTSLVLIALLGVLAATALCVAIELLFPSRAAAIGLTAGASPESAASHS